MNSLKKNFLYNITYQILIVFIPLITAPYLSRVLGSYGIGMYSYHYSIANYFVIFCGLGVANYGNRSIAIVRDDKANLSKTFSDILSLRLLIATTIALFYVIYSVIFSEQVTISLIFLFYVISGVIDISWLYFGLEQFKITVTRNMIIKFSTVIGIFVFVKTADDLWKYTLIISLGFFISQLYLWFNLKQYVKIIKPDFKTWKTHLKSFLILFVPLLAYSIYKLMDKIMLGSMAGMDNVGWYENSEKIVSIPLSIITAFGTVMLPRMSNIMSKGDINKGKKYIETSFNCILIISVAMVAGVMGINKNFTPLYFGDGFDECVTLINIMIFSLIFMSIANVIRTQFLIPTKKDNIYVISTVIGAALNFILNVIFIPKFGAVGAAIATLCSEFIVAFVQMFMTRKHFNYFKMIFNVLPYFIIGIIMTLSVSILGNILTLGIFTIVIQVIAGVFIFCLLSFFVVKFKNDEFSIFIKNIIRKKGIKL